MLAELDYDYRTVLAPGNTGAGAGVVEPVPASERQRLLACTFHLVTSAAVATRTPILSVRDGSGVSIARAVAGFGLTASDAADFSFAYGLAEWDSATSQAASGPCPLIPLSAGDTLRIDVASMDVADQISAVRFVLLQIPVRPDE